MENRIKFKSTALVALLLAGGVMTPQAQAVDLPPNPAMLNLGTAAGFTLLAGSALVVASPVTISGTGSHKVGLAMNGAFPPNDQARVGGLQPTDIFIGADATHGNQVALDAQADAAAARAAGKDASFANDKSAISPTQFFFGNLASAIPLKRGYYAQGIPESTPMTRGAAALTLTGEMTLDGQGDPNSVFIFDSPAAFATSANAKVNLINEARADHVYWLLGAGFTAAAGTLFNGIVIADGAILVGAGAVINGQILGLNTSAVAIGTAADPNMTYFNSPAAIPEPSVYGVAMGAVVLGAVVMMRRRKTRGNR